MSDQIFILRALSILDEPRVLPLPDALWRTYLELYLHACRVECGIALPPMGYMEWRMRRHGKNLQDDLRLLELAGLVTEDGTGRYFVRGSQAGFEREKGMELFRKQR